MDTVDQERCIEDCPSVIAGFYRAIFVEREPRRLIELLAPEFEFHSCDGIETGRSEFMNYVGILLEAFPDLKLQIRLAISEHGALAVRWNCSGTNRGWAAGVAPSGCGISQEGVAVFHLAGGRIRRLQCFADAWHAASRTIPASDGNSAESSAKFFHLESDATPAPDPADIVRRFSREILEAGHLDRLSALVADSFLLITPQFAPATTFETRILLTEWSEAFLPRTVKIEVCMSDAAHAIALIHVRAQYDGILTELGWNAADSRMDFRVALVAHCEDRRVRVLEAFYNPERMWKTGFEIE
ncbi:MAG: ester cyclase [bacterium]|nr:ester cyclase [bacterium]